MRKAIIRPGIDSLERAGYQIGKKEEYTQQKVTLRKEEVVVDRQEGDSTDEEEV